MVELRYCIVGVQSVTLMIESPEKEKEEKAFENKDGGVTQASPLGTV